MIGEYVGNPKCQHLVKYNKISILFYAIVPNEGHLNCILPEESYEFFNQWGLDKVSLERVGLYSDFEVMKKDLEKVYKDVASSSIA